MPIDPTAIESFLKQQFAPIPEFKGASKTWLYQSIYDTTGVPYQPLTEPRQHQLEGMAFACYLGRAMLWYDMRTGKSKMSLDWATQLRRSGLWKGTGLVIAHGPVGLSVWEQEAKRHSTLRVMCVTTEQELIEALESKPDLIVVAITMLQYMFTLKRASKQGKGPLKLYPDGPLLRRAAANFSLCIIDEIHRYKDMHSLWFRVAERIIGNCQFRLGLTGTPQGRDGYSIWAQLYLIDEGATLSPSFTFFKAAFGKLKDNYWSRTGEEWVFDKAKIPTLRKFTRQRAMYYKLDEIRSVETYRSQVSLRMTQEQWAAYREVINKVIKLRQGQVEEQQNSFMRLRQISSGFLPFEDEDSERRLVVFPNTPKLQWLASVVEELEDYQYIIFHEFTKSGQMICDLLKKAKRRHAWLYGQTKDRAGVIEEFQSGKAQVLVANTATGGISVDLWKAYYLIFYESPSSPIIRAQAEARPLAEARGDRPLMIDDLVVSPVERKILAFQQEGADLARLLRGASGNAIFHTFLVD